MDCIFCKINNGEIPSFTIYEDEIVRAILDVHPDSIGHTLIIPKEHYKDLDDIDEKVLAHIMTIAKKVKKILEDNLHCSGMTLIQNNGNVQEIKHYHLHLKPQYINQTKKLTPEEVYNLIKK